MTSNQDRYTNLMKQRSAAGMVLREGIEAMLSMTEDSPAKQEMMRMIEEYNEVTVKARLDYLAPHASYDPLAPVIG